MLNSKLRELLYATTHKEVVDIMLRYVVLDYYSIHTTPTYTLVTPKKKTFDYVPMLCVHTDTIKRNEVFKLKEQSMFKVVSAENSVLGADDRAGCWIASELMDYNFEVSFLICDLEEVGGKGSYEASQDDVVYEYIVDNVSSFIGLDRRGARELALYGYESQDFMRDVVDYFVLGGYEEGIGSFTDASNLARVFNLCCLNLSIGYYNEHTYREYLNIDEMEQCFVNVLYNMPECLWTKQYTVSLDFDLYEYYGGYVDDDIEDFKDNEFFIANNYILGRDNV